MSVKSGYGTNEHSIQYHFKMIDDDLTTPHQYVLQITRTRRHLHFKWFIRSASLGSDALGTNFLYATQTISLSDKGPLRYYVQLSLDAAEADPSIEVPVTHESYFNVFDLQLQEIKEAFTPLVTSRPRTLSVRPRSIEVASLMPLLRAREGYHKENQQKQIYSVNQSIQTEGYWTLNALATAETNCDPMDPDAGKCTYQSDWIDTYDTWSTGEHERGMIAIKVSVLPAIGKNPKGLWPSVWMLPRSSPPLSQATWIPYPWPINGELNIFESWGSYPNKYATSLHYGMDSAARWSYMGAEYYSASTFKTTDANEYAISWDFSESDTIPVFKWWVKTPEHNGTWWLIREQKTNHLAPSQKKIDCPDLGKYFPAAPGSSADTCFANVFKAGQAALGLDSSMRSGYYLIANLAIGGHFDGNPVDDLSGSQMKIESVDFYKDVIDPRNL